MILAQYTIQYNTYTCIFVWLLVTLHFIAQVNREVFYLSYSNTAITDCSTRNIQYIDIF